MKLALVGLIIGGFSAWHPLAQPAPPPGGKPGGFPGLADPARRTEMIVDRLAEDIGLDRDQRRAIRDVFVQAQTSAKPIQDDLQAARKAVKEALAAGKTPAELDTLHQQIGTCYAKLAAIQSAAFGDVLKLLKEDQKADADIVYEVLGFVAGSGGRGGPPMRGGPSGWGPGHFGRGVPPPPDGHGEAAPPRKPLDRK